MLENLNKKDIETSLSIMMAPSIDYADLYFEHTITESWQIEDSIVKTGSYSIDSGVGSRAVSGDKTGFSSDNILTKESIEKSANFAKCIAKSGKKNSIIKPKKKKITTKYNSLNTLNSICDEDKIALLRKMDRIVRKEHKIKQANISLTGQYSEILVVSSDGCFEKDIRPMVRLSITVIAEHNNRRQSASFGGGGRYDYRYFIDNQLDEYYAKEAVRQALVGLSANPAPAGEMPVILGAGWPGVLLHEAIGHGLEGDFNRKGTSVYSKLMGHKCASELCTIVDNGTLANRRGSLNIDDEGTPTQETVLIEKGVVKNFMYDKLNAKLMSTATTANARRQSYAYPTMPRMTNTYMLNGKSDLQEMIASIDKGIYAVNFDGGQVDITSGKFVFSANESYLINKGKISYPISGVTLVGYGHTILKNISMVGNDCRLDSGVGVCGKEGQYVPVGVGQPSLKISGLTVGGVKN